MRFEAVFNIVNPTVPVRWGFEKFGNPTVRFGAVFRNQKYYGAVFSEIRNPTVRFGAVFRYRKSYGAVRCGFHKSDILRAVRRGFPLNGFSCGAVPLPVGKTVQHRFFSTVHRMNKPRFRTVLPIFLGALTNRCFSTVHRTIKPYNTAVSYRSGTFSRGTNETAVSLRAPYE